MSDSIEPIKKPSEKYASLFELADDIREDEVKVNDRCKLCRSEHRAEAEEYWVSKRRNNLATAAFLQQRGFDITDKSVKRHMEDCFLPQQKELSLKRYVSRMRKYAEMTNDRAQTVREVRGILKKELAETAAEAEMMSVSEKGNIQKNMIALASQILACEEQERKINEDWKPAKAVLIKLEEIVDVEMLHAPDLAKPVLAKVVKTLFEGIKEIKTDK